MSDLFPPSIKREAEDPEMQQWAFEATAALEAGRVAGLALLERYKEAGAALIKAKAKCGHTKWLPWLKSNGISRTSALRCMKAAKCATSGAFEDDVAVIAESGEEQEKLAPSEVASEHVSKPQNFRAQLKPPESHPAVQSGSAKPAPKSDVPRCEKCTNIGTLSDCKACKKLRIEWDAIQRAKALEFPDRLLEVAKSVERYQKIAKSAKILSKRIRKEEGNEVYQRLMEGQAPLHGADKIMNVARHYEQRTARKACPDCDLSLKSGASAHCATCKSKGWLTIADVEVLDGQKEASK